MDSMMPGMDGFVLAEQIPRCRTSPPAIIMLLSSGRNRPIGAAANWASRPS